MMRTPIGHLAAGIIVPPAELIMTIGLSVLQAIGNLRSGTEPEVPIQFGRRLDRCDGTAGWIAADTAFDGLDFADAPGTHQLESQAKHAVINRSLLAAGLQDAARLLGNL